VPDIDPSETVDRDAEQTEFASMLCTGGHRRMLVIGDAPGTGKSTLLRRLQYNCMWEHQVPVSLVLLEKDPDVPEERSTISSAIEFVHWIREDLAAGDIAFPVYDFLNDLRLQFLWPPIATSLTSVEEYLEAQFRAQGMSLHGEASATSVDGGTVAGLYIKELRLEPQRSWARPEQERRSSQGCVEAFFRDLRRACSTRDVVLLVDSYDRRQDGLRDWVLNSFIRPMCLESKRPERLLVVLAGEEQKLPQFQQMLGANFDGLVASRKLLNWTEQHVRDFLRVHKYSQLSEVDFAFVYDKINHGWSIRDALQLAEILARAPS
jgi:hypothetical protein